MWGPGLLAGLLAPTRPSTPGWHPFPGWGDARRGLLWTRPCFLSFSAVGSLFLVLRAGIWGGGQAEPCVPPPPRVPGYLLKASCLFGLFNLFSFLPGRGKGVISHLPCCLALKACLSPPWPFRCVYTHTHTHKRCQEGLQLCLSSG